QQVNLQLLQHTLFFDSGQTQRFGHAPSKIVQRAVVQFFRSPSPLHLTKIVILTPRYRARVTSKSFSNAFGEGLQLSGWWWRRAAPKNWSWWQAQLPDS